MLHPFIVYLDRIIATTRNYGHVSPDTVADVVERIKTEFYKYKDLVAAAIGDDGK